MRMSRTRVFIVDDSLTIRAMLATVLEADERLQVVGIAANVEEADAMLSHVVPDVVLLDIRLPGRSAFESLRDLKGWLDKPVIAFSSLMRPGSPEAIEALRLGAAAAFNKAELLRDTDALITLIRDAAHGQLKPVSAPAPAPVAIPMPIQHGPGLGDIFARPAYA